MPELPEVETVRRTLAPALVGRRIVRASLLRPDFGQRPDGRPCSPRDLLQGMTVRALDRRGKQLAILTREGPVLIAHLGMTGQLRAAATETPLTHIHARWHLDSGTTLTFRDARRFGGLWALPSEADLHARWSALGPDALLATPADLRSRSGESRRAIKAVLLDQAVIAGVGNIYADEALFLAGIHPLRTPRSLRPQEWEALAAAIHRTLNAAIGAGGSTLRDYIDALGVRGRAQADHAVYARAGEPCLTCTRPLRGIRIGGRATVYCPRCQPRRPARAVKNP